MTLWPPKVAISLGCTSPLTEKFNIIKILIKGLRNLNKGLYKESLARLYYSLQFFFIKRV